MNEWTDTLPITDGTYLMLSPADAHDLRFAQLVSAELDEGRFRLWGNVEHGYLERSPHGIDNYIGFLWLGPLPLVAKDA